MPQHIWGSVSNPATLHRRQPGRHRPVHAGQVLLPQGFPLKQNPNYWNKSAVQGPAIDFPSYSSNANLVPPIASGQIDWAGNNLARHQLDYLAKSQDNHTWLDSQPYFAANNVVPLCFNVTKAPLNDPAVRQAISYGINRQQLSTQGETGYEPPATSTSGLLLPTTNTFLDPSLANNLPATGDPAKVASDPDRGRLHQVGGKWTKNGQTITFSISDPIPYTDYYTDDQLIANQLNALGFNVTVERHRQPDACGRPTSPTALSTPRSTGATRARTRTTSTRTGSTARSPPRSASRPPATTAGSRTRPPRPRWPSSPAPTTRPPRRRPSPSWRRSCHPGAGGAAAVRRRLERVLDPELHGLADQRQPVHDADSEHARTWSRRPAPQAGLVTATGPRKGRQLHT